MDSNTLGDMLEPGDLNVTPTSTASQFTMLDELFQPTYTGKGNGWADYETLDT